MNAIGVDDKPLADTQRTPRWMSSLQVWLWPAWLTVLSVWTVALLTPEPARFSHATFPKPYDFFLAKSLHLCAYAGLAAAGVFLALPAGWRWLPIGLLSVHAFLTEYLQTFVPLRTGCWQDVLLDHVGIGAGLLVAWLLERRLQPRALTSPG